MSKLLHDLRTWFFAEGDPRTAALLRIGFSAVYLLILWDLYPVLDLLFGHDGLYGTLEPYPYALEGLPYLLYHHDSPLGLAVWFWTSVAVATLSLLGVAPRLTLPLTYFSMFLFRERGPFITFGADLVLHCIGLWLLFLDTGAAFSVRRQRSERPGSIALWPVRAIQVQVALIYLITGLAKLNTVPWQEGTAVYYALHVGDVTKAGPPAWLLAQRWLLIAMNYGTLAIELGAPFALLFYRPLRAHAVLALIVLHASIDVLMSIRFFSLAMYTGLLASVDAEVWSLAERAWTRTLVWARLKFPTLLSRPTEPREKLPI